MYWDQNTSMECCEETVSTWCSQHMAVIISLTWTSTSSRGSNHTLKGLHTTHGPHTHLHNCLTKSVVAYRDCGVEWAIPFGKHIRRPVLPQRLIMLIFLSRLGFSSGEIFTYAKPSICVEMAHTGPQHWDCVPVGPL